MKILVTGAAGFIGSSLAMRLLARGDTVIGVDCVNDYYDVSLKEARLTRLAEAGGALGIGALLKAAGLAASSGEGNRLIDGGGVRVDSTVISDKALKLGAGTYVVQVGKRKFARVTLA